MIDSLAPGGAETSLAAMAGGLVDAGIELHVLALGPRMDLAGQLASSGATVLQANGGPGRTANVRSVIHVAQELKPAAIHTTLYEADIAGRTAGFFLRIPTSTSIVNDSYGVSHYAESSRHKLHAARALDALTAIPASRFHAITQAIAESVPGRLGIRRDRVEVIPRGRDPRAFPFQSPSARLRVRSELGIPPDTSVILTIGRHEPQKGLHHVLDALPEVVSQVPGTVLLLAGREGRSTSGLLSRAQGLELDVRFLGHRTDVADLLSAADVFCFPSEREGFGGVLVEAMASGCPVVATQIPTSREVLSSPHGPVGLLTGVGDSRALAQGLTAVLSDQRRATSLAHRAFDKFMSTYTLEGVVSRMAGFFRGVAHSREVRG